jgi:glycosyltransferase involved in cell wall biosynthesis
VPPPAAPAPGPAPARAAAVPVTLVVPCYNEERALPYLANTLDSVARELAPRYALAVVLVDDASTDATPEVLRRHFGGRAECTIVRHEGNRGVAQAILTGARAARTEVVASIDCDCTYDPHELGRLLPLLGDGVDVVTGSPYHPLGRVRNVPRWRLALSRSASAIYRVVLRQRLHTYTSCFRAYRRSALLGLEIRHSGFLGVAEMLARLDLAGRTVVECPTTLHVRVLGRSKMRVARTVLGHLRLLTELVVLRARGAPAGGRR